MKVNANFIDGVVSVDGESRRVEIEDLAPDLWAAQYDGSTGTVETRPPHKTKKGSQELLDGLLNRWRDAEGEEEPAEDPTLAILRDRARQRVKGGFRGELAPVVSEYPELEIESWYKQEQQARDLLSDTDADPEEVAPLLVAIADEESEETPRSIAETVVEKAEEFSTMIGPAIRKRRRLYRDIDAAYEAEDREALEAISWA